MYKGLNYTKYIEVPKKFLKNAKFTPIEEVLKETEAECMIKKNYIKTIENFLLELKNPNEENIAKVCLYETLKSKQLNVSHEELIENCKTFIKKIFKNIASETREVILNYSFKKNFYKEKFKDNKEKYKEISKLLKTDTITSLKTEATTQLKTNVTKPLELIKMNFQNIENIENIENIKKTELQYKISNLKDILRFQQIYKKKLKKNKEYNENKITIICLILLAKLYRMNSQDKFEECTYKKLVTLEHVENFNQYCSQVDNNSFKIEHIL